MEALIKVVEKAIKDEEGMVEYYAKKLVDDTKSYTEAKTHCQQKVLDLKADLDQLKAIIKKKLTA